MTDTHGAEHHDEHGDTVSFKDRAVRILAILGLIALLLLGAWGIIQIAFTLYGFFGNSAPTSPSAQTQKTEIVAPQGNGGVSSVSTQASSKPVTSYVPAKTAARTFYGSPDLSVTMGQIINYGGRYSAQFTIQNVGSNVAPYGWTFNAALPASPTYTYTSNAQQALNPGDKVVYTLGFTAAQGGYSYGYTTPTYPNCGYTANYTYNGVYNYPGVSYGCNTSNYAYPYNQNSYNYNSYNYGSNIVTVTVDPSNYIYESSEYNNSATARTY